MDTILQLLYSPPHIIICGDINTDYLTESEKKNQMKLTQEDILHT